MHRGLYGRAINSLKYRIRIIFGPSTKKILKQFVIKIKLSLLDWRDKSMHYPESPKVSLHPNLRSIHDLGFRGYGRCCFE